MVITSYSITNDCTFATADRWPWLAFNPIIYIIILYLILYSKLYSLVLCDYQECYKDQAEKTWKILKYPVVSFASLTVRSYSLPPPQYNILMIRRSEQQLLRYNLRAASNGQKSVLTAKKQLRVPRCFNDCMGSI